MKDTGITILYDNHAEDGLRPGWGFSAFIRTEGAVVVFDAGADIVRLSVLNHDAGDQLKAIKSRVEKPIVADIHFQYKLALKAIEAGFDKIRINPGNIGAEWKVREVTKAAIERDVPIRIGVNSGSLPEDVLAQYGHDDPRAFCEAALREIRVLEDGVARQRLVENQAQLVDVASEIGTRSREHLG